MQPTNYAKPPPPLVVTLACLLVYHLSMSPAALADGSSSSQKNYEARLDFGLMYLYSANNLNPQASSRYISSLDDTAKSQTRIMPVPVPSFSYTFEQYDKTKLFFNSRPPIDEAGTLALGFGLSKPVEDIGTAEIALFFTPFVEVWENPYLVDQARQETSTSRYGALFRLKDIVNSQFGIDMVYLNDDVDDDIIGEIEPALGRDGSVYALDTKYSFSPVTFLTFQPVVGFRYGDYAGEANSFIKYKLRFRTIYRAGRTLFMPELSYGHSYYQAANPIFNRTRKQSSYGAHLLVSHFAPFGYSNLALQLLLGYKVGNSNIDFYDTRGITSGVFLSYSL